MDTTWLTARLPRSQLIPRRTEADYYGASDLIAAALRYPAAPRSIASWMHAVSYEQHLDYPELLFPEGNRVTRHLVATTAQVKLLKARGYLRAYAVGVPYLYVEPANAVRMPGSLLVMPAHTVAKALLSFEEEAYGEQLDQIRGRFDRVVACISAPCARSGIWTKTLERRGIPWILGADSSDRNALRRMARLFASFEYMTTNTLGSHIAYAAFSGCKVSICGPYPRYRLEDFKELAWYKKNWGKAQQVIDAMSEPNVRARHPMLFKEPWDAQPLEDWAAQVLGLDNKRSHVELARLLGWTVTGQTEVVIHRAARRTADLAQAVVRRIRRSDLMNSFKGLT